MELEETRLRLPAFPGHQGKEAGLTQVPIRTALQHNLGFYKKGLGSCHHPRARATRPLPGSSPQPPLSLCSTGRWCQDGFQRRQTPGQGEPSLGGAPVASCELQNEGGGLPDSPALLD